MTIIASATAKHLAGMSLEKFHDIINDSNESEEEKNESNSISTKAKDASKQIANALKKALEPHKTVKESIKLFKENLTELIEHLNSLREVNLPLLIFVDELDRCRPDYAIELLEGIKHLFGVPGVTFVIATNIAQLSESIKAVYGSGFDGQRYLQRFFDLQYTLSAPDNKSFSRLMLSEIPLPDLPYIVYGLEHDPNVHPANAPPPNCA